MANYEAMPLVKQLNIIREEVANKSMLSAKGSMWQMASQELTEAGSSLSSATGNIAPEWDDGAGTKFVAVSRQTLSQIDTWQQNIDGAKPHDKIYLVANTLEPTRGIVEEQWVLAMKAVATAQANAALAPGGGRALTQAEIDAVMLPFQQTAGRAMNVLGGLYVEAANAVTAASGGDPMSNPQAPFNGSPMSSSPSTSSASPGGAPPGGAAPGGTPPGGAALGGAAPGGAAPGGAPPGGAAPGAAGADPSLSGGLAGGAPTPTPTPPGLGTTPPPGLGGTGTVPPFIPPVGGLGSGARGGGLGGGFGGGGGGGGGRVPGVGLGGSTAGAQIPAAGGTVSPPTQPTQAGAPVVPQGPPTGGGTAGAGGAGGVPPMMPPMGGMGAGMGGGGGSGSGSGAAQRPINGRPRNDGRTPGLPPVLSGKAGKADANTFAVRNRRSTIETDVPSTVQLIDEDLWQVGDRPATAVGDRTGRRAGR